MPISIFVKSSVSISITRHLEKDHLLLEALSSLARLREVRGEILILDQKYSATIDAFCDTVPQTGLQFRYLPIESCGIAQARNMAIELCQEELLLFTEPDALVSPNWACRLGETLAAGAAMVGGRIIPAWRATAPIVVRSRLIQDLYSLLDLGTEVKPTHKIVGCNFGINLALIGRENASFNPAFGRVPGSLAGGEETELCRRVRAAGHDVVYDGRAVVEHQIGIERCTYRWLIRRIYAAGRSRSQQGGLPDPTNKGGWDWYTLLALPLYTFYIFGFIAGKLGPR